MPLLDKAFSSISHPHVARLAQIFTLCTGLYAQTSPAEQPKPCPVKIEWGREKPSRVIQGVPIREIGRTEMEVVEIMYKKERLQKCGTPYEQSANIDEIRDLQVDFIRATLTFMGDTRSNERITRTAQSMVTGLTDEKIFSEGAPAAHAITDGTEPSEDEPFLYTDKTMKKKRKIIGCLVTLPERDYFSASEYLKHISGLENTNATFITNAKLKDILKLLSDHEVWHCLGKNEKAADWGSTKLNMMTDPVNTRTAALEIAKARLVSAFMAYDKPDIREKYGYKMYTAIMDAMGLESPKLSDLEYNQLALYLWQNNIIQFGEPFEATMGKLMTMNKDALKNPDQKLVVEKLGRAMWEFKFGAEPTVR